MKSTYLGGQRQDVDSGRLQIYICNPLEKIRITKMNDKFRLYEQLKAEWIKNNPKARTQEINTAVKALMKEAGL